MPALYFDRLAGDEQKQDGLDRVEAAHRGFVRRMRAAAKAYALVHGQVTADDVRRLAARAGRRPRHKNAWGAIFRGKGWVITGYAPSTLVSNHAHVNPIWRWEEPSGHPARRKEVTPA